MTLPLPHLIPDQAIQDNFDAISQNLQGLEVEVALAQKADDSQPAVSVFNSVVQAVGATITFAFDSEYFDVGGLHSTSSNTSRLTAQEAGLYLIVGEVQFASAVTGALGITVSGGGVSGSIDLANQQTTTLSIVRVLAAGQYAQLIAGQTGGGSVNAGPVFSMARLSKGS